MNIFRKNPLSFGALGLIAAVLATPAQASNGEPGGFDSTAGSRHYWHGSGKSAERAKEVLARRHAELHDKLNLRPEQEPAWQAFVTAMTPTGSWKRVDRAEWQKLTAPERMEKKLVLLKESEATMTDRLAATKALYASLTPEQQKIFNENFMIRRHIRN